MKKTIVKTLLFILGVLYNLTPDKRDQIDKLEAELKETSEIPPVPPAAAPVAPQEQVPPMPVLVPQVLAAPADQVQV